MIGPPIEHGWLRIERGLITALGRGRPPGHQAERVELGDAILLPGLVNAHTHLEFSALASPMDPAGGLPGWIKRVVAARRQRHESDATGSAIRRGLAESAAAGVTLIGEIATTVPSHAYDGPGPAVRVFREGLGLRADAVRSLSRLVAADLDRMARSGLAAGVSPHAPYSVHAALGQRLMGEAIGRGLPVAMHLCESREEEELLTSRSGPFRQLLEDLGAWETACPPVLLPSAEWISRLARARRGIVVHATHIGRDPVALARLARHRDRLAVVVCPRTTGLISNLPPPVPLLMSAGIRVAIGTDSRASNPDLSILAECCTLVEAGLGGPEDALRMATVHGAWALARERHSGCLAVGRPADLAILRPTGPAANPWAAALDPATRVAATVRCGRLIAGTISPTDGVD